MEQLKYLLTNDELLYICYTAPNHYIYSIYILVLLNNTNITRLHNEIMPFPAIWDVLQIYHSRTEIVRKLILWFYLCESNLFNDCLQNNPDTQAENNLWLPNWNRGEWLKFGINSLTIYIGWINNSSNTRNYFQYPMISRNGKENEKTCIYIYKYICYTYII